MQLEGFLWPVVSRVNERPPRTTQEKVWTKDMKDKNSQFVYVVGKLEKNLAIEPGIEPGTWLLDKDVVTEPSGWILAVQTAMSFLWLTCEAQEWRSWCRCLFEDENLQDKTFEKAKTTDIT